MTRIDTGPPEKETSPVGHRGREKEISSATLPETELIVNADRVLIESRPGVKLWRLPGGRSYEVVSTAGSWRFSLLYQAQGKFERLTPDKSSRIRRSSLQPGS
jgi:hypothetical protein